MTDRDAQGALAGISVLEVGNGVAGAYCSKLFADMGAAVTRESLASEPSEPVADGLFAAYLQAGKLTTPLGADQAAFDLVVVGEDTARLTSGEGAAPRVARIKMAWFGNDGPYAEWRGSDVAVQALAGLLDPLGPIDGPPQFMGAHQATMLAGVTAFCAGVAELLAARKTPQDLEVSILESIICLSELQMCQSDVLGNAVPRLGVNRFQRTCPLSIHRCKEGWIGITPITPAQWQAFCKILGLPELAAQADLNFPPGRLAAVDVLEAAFDRRFPTKTADEWAALAREHKVPMVVVPNASGILQHPIFNARESFAEFAAGARHFRVPRTPLRLERTPPRQNLDETSAGADAKPVPTPPAPDDAPLAGVRVADFSMGWAGPLATRMLADFGAEVIKVEAGRYPDWWRAVDWSPDAIASKQFEESKHFSALNRGKHSVSVDLTQARGVALAKALVSSCDVVIENQAAGVMERLGLGYSALAAGRPDLVMMSMSAFGAGNAWSDTRAYGSVLEQGSGLPSFCGQPDWPPTMAHIAYGDPVGGVYGCASLLVAIFHQRCSGEGQWINNTQIEAMLPFTTPALLSAQALGREPKRLGNRHPYLAPHGIFMCADEAWIAVAVDAAAWPALLEVIQVHDMDTLTNEDAKEAALATWLARTACGRAVAQLQHAGISAAPVQGMDVVERNPHLRARAFFYDIDRPHVGKQVQAGLAVRYGAGARLPMRGLAPYLGGDSETLLQRYAGVASEEFHGLVADGIVCLEPTQLRGS